MALLPTSTQGSLATDSFWGGYGLQRFFRQVRPAKQSSRGVSCALQREASTSAPCTAVGSLSPSISSSPSTSRRSLKGGLTAPRAGRGAALAVEEPLLAATNGGSVGRRAAAEDAVALAQAAAATAKQAALLAEHGDSPLIGLEDMELHATQFGFSRGGGGSLGVPGMLGMDAFGQGHGAAYSAGLPSVAPLEWRRFLSNLAPTGDPIQAYILDKHRLSSTYTSASPLPKAKQLEAAPKALAAGLELLKLKPQTGKDAGAGNSPAKGPRTRVVVQSGRKGKRLAPERRSIQEGAAAAKAKGMLRGVESKAGARAGAGSSVGGDGLKELMNSTPGTTVLLTKTEEIELTTEIQKLMKLEAAAAELQERLGRAPSQDEWAQVLGLSPGELQARLWRGRQSKLRMLSCNMGLVISIARKYSTWGLSLEEIITRGTGGLIKAMEKFDFRRGFKFSTYAHWWVRQAIGRSVTEQSRTVRMPPHVYELMSRINKARDLLNSELGRAPSDDEVSELVGMSSARLRRVLKSAKPMVSMDKPTAMDEEQTLGSYLASPVDESMEVEIERKLLSKDLQKALGTLLPREREVLKMRYGLIDGRARTLEEVGARFQVTRERIRQLEHRALRKLRQPERSCALQEYVE